MYLTYVLPFMGLYVLRKYFQYRKAVRSIGNLPGLRTLCDDMTHVFLKRIPGIAAGDMSAWDHKYQDFVHYGADIFSMIGILPGTVNLFVADADVIKEVTAARTRFPKALHLYGVLAIFGNNIVITEGNEWKKHRKITAPAFSDRNNRLVWDESINTMVGLFETVWGDKKEIVVDNVVDLTVPIALYIIGAAGFGKRVSWEEDVEIPEGHTVAFKDALHLVSTHLHIKILCPNWLIKWGPVKLLRDFGVAYDQLLQYMTEMIQARKSLETKEESHDLFSNLLEANDDPDDTDGTMGQLTDSEVIGDVFIFLIAGHETTAHTLAYLFVMLALYPDEQKALYDHVMSVIPDGQPPRYEDMGRLSYSLAVFYETLRLFPPVYNIPKCSAEDTTLTTRNAAGESIRVPVPKGAQITIHTTGLHYNPRYWPDPHTFKPSRFLGDWPRDAFLSFSAGGRGCLGRKFSETEAVVIISLLISRYKISVKEEPQFASETLDERRARLTQSASSLTVYPIKSPLVFTRR